MTLTLLYFARLRERFACAGETLQLADPLPEAPHTVADLLALLVARGGVWAEELGGAQVFRVAVDQYLVKPEYPLRDGAEVALFPPVTGG